MHTQLFRTATARWSRGLVMSLSGLLMWPDATAADATQPIAPPDLVLAEHDGLVAGEAEHFIRQELTTIRAFHITAAGNVPQSEPDGDPPHLAGAARGAYVEVLPDSRRDHGEKLIHGQNFSNNPGKLAVLTYRVHFQNPGRYFVWVRAFSTGSEDNGLHVGINGTWPESGQRLQWCEGKQTWRWESRQRTEQEHCGEPHRIFLDVPSPGIHEIQFSMREDGFEFDRWLLTTARDFARPDGPGPDIQVASGKLPAAPDSAVDSASASPGTTNAPSQPNARANRSRAEQGKLALPGSDRPLQLPRQPDGNGAVEISGELRQWHKVTLTVDGPYAHELDQDPNPFVNYQMDVKFTHESGTPSYLVPGYFAADGNAAETSASSGTKWRAHLSPDKPGRWDYQVSLVKGRLIVETDYRDPLPASPAHDVRGSFQIEASDKSGRDLRAHGRLQYVGERYLRFAGSGQYFLKAGADAPETLLACVDFDNTIAGNPKKVPLKTWAPHVQDWNEGDPTWQNGKGKGLIGAVNYLSGKGCNAFSFLTYNAGGDGDDVWPFVHRDDKMHYDCSKLDQWGMVFDHATTRGMYLHFKMQETENDDDRHGAKGDQQSVPESLDGGSAVRESLDGGNLGPQRRLYCRELVARFGHNLALNWNLGEENTQSTQQQRAMIRFLRRMDPYQHNIVLHTFPEQQDKVYQPLLGDRSMLSGLSLQNSGIHDTHWQVVKWVRQSEKSGHPWVVAFDESGTAAHGQCPDLGYKEFDGRDTTGKMIYTEHEVRQQTLWGTLMGGGAGVEYYFGYRFAENDLLCEDWRSRDRSWDYCRIALNFFHEHQIPFPLMQPADELIAADSKDNSKYCLAKPGDIYLIYRVGPSDVRLDLSGVQGEFQLHWFNPRTGGELQSGSPSRVEAGQPVSIGQPPSDQESDWLAVVRRL